MPSPEAILSLAARTANEYRMLAIGWHVYLGTILVALLVVAGFGYGAMGVFTLGVTLDWGLLAGATLLGVVAGVSTRWRSEGTDRGERTRREDAA